MYVEQRALIQRQAQWSQRVRGERCLAALHVHGALCRGVDQHCVEGRQRRRPRGVKSARRALAEHHRGAHRQPCARGLHHQRLGLGAQPPGAQPHSRHHTHPRRRRRRELHTAPQRQRPPAHPPRRPQRRQACQAALGLEQQPAARERSEVEAESRRGARAAVLLPPHAPGRGRGEDKGEAMARVRDSGVPRRVLALPARRCGPTRPVLLSPRVLARVLPRLRRGGGCNRPSSPAVAWAGARCKAGGGEGEEGRRRQQRRRQRLHKGLFFALGRGLPVIFCSRA